MDFAALHVALSGLRAAQRGLDTSSHNIANASTDGYTRQRVDLRSRLPRQTPVGQVGTGVDVSGISRSRDMFLDARVRASLSGAAETGMRAYYLNRAEAALGEPERGISLEVNRLFDSFEELSLASNDTATRMGVLGQINAVASRVNQVAGEIEALRTDVKSTMVGKIDQVNDVLRQIASLNGSILETSATRGAPNDLRDQRDILVDRLSTMIGTRTIDDEYGGVQVLLGGISLVSKSSSLALSVDISSGQILHPSGIAVTPGGELRGLQQSLASDIPGLMARLDTFVIDLATAANGIHASGFHAGGSGGALFTYNAGSPGATLAGVLTNPALLATATTPGPPFPTFDGGLASRLANLRTSLVAAGGTASLQDSFSSIVTGLGRDVASMATASSTQQGLAEAAERARMSVHGVSVDEEMVSLMEYQRMYEAAARVITTVDQMLDVLINRTGIVGR